MKSRWNETEAARCADALALRAYTSRLLGSDKSLVMHGGGNTSVKLTQPNLFGESEDILYVKGSGSSLETIQPSDFVPVRLAGVRRLIERDSLSSRRMAEEFGAQALRPGVPSIESILHAILPYKYVEHTHADTVLAVANTVNGARHLQSAFGDRALIVPYHHSGLALAKACAAVFTAQASSRTIGMVLLHHGVLAFGHSARESYEHMIALVDAAEAYLHRQDAWTLSGLSREAKDARPTTAAIAALRRDISSAAGFPLLLTRRDDPLIHGFVNRPDAAPITQQGPATPHHAIFTKRVPLLGVDVAAFSAQYRQYIQENRPATAEECFLDPAPRITLTPEFGLCAAGISAHHANAAAEIYRHTIEIISRASLLDTYQALPPAEILAAEIEYGGFEHALLARRTPANRWLGEIALVAHADSPVGQPCIAALLEGGAAVAGLERGTATDDNRWTPAYQGITCATTDKNTRERALEQLVDTFGGLDMLITDDLSLIEPCLPLLKLSPSQGRVAFLSPQGQALTVFHQTAATLAADRIRLNAVSYAPTESEQAARLAAALCGPLFAGTSGALVPVHGFNLVS